jgi:hypothetical protein
LHSAARGHIKNPNVFDRKHAAQPSTFRRNSMRGLIILGALLCAFLIANPVFAGNLLGEWESTKGAGHGAVSGTPDHDLMPPGEYFTQQDIAWTLKITSQEGNGFHGQWCSAKMCEGLSGVLRRDGSILMVDEDSTFFATMYGPDMELCITEPGQTFRVASCHIMKKK